MSVAEKELALGLTTCVQEEAFSQEKTKHHESVNEILLGLSEKQKNISPKYFYDAYGSALFEKIMQLPEYYPTRTELTIFKQYADEMQTCIGTEHVILEPGAGNLEKIRHLITSLKPQAYVPSDISGDFLFESAKQLKSDFPDLNIHAVAADIQSNIALPSTIEHEKRLLFFPGSTIGNYTQAQALDFLKYAHEQVGRDGGLLIGVDLIKDRSTLQHAYNDAQGITALFNINVLNHIGRLLHIPFDTTLFEHQAIYNDDENRIEMYLVSLAQQTYTLPTGQLLKLQQGEKILTEYSCKYSIESFQALALQAGFKLDTFWTDDEQLFSVQYYKRL